MSEPTQSVRQFVEDAYQLISPSSPTVPLHGNDLSKGVQFLNMLLSEYSSTGLLITISKQISYNLVAYQGEVTLGSADYVPTPDITSEGRLVTLENAWIQLSGLDYPLIDESRNSFFSAYKYEPLAGLPRYVIFKPETNLTRVQVFPKPSQAYILFLYGKFAVNTLTVNDDLSSLPIYYQLYLQFALARLVCMYKGRAEAWTDKLEDMYKEYKTNIIASSSVNLELQVNQESWLNGSWRVEAGI